MGPCACNGGQMMCSFGTAPANLMVLPAKKTMATLPAATIMDNIPMTNIMPFGMCNSVANPATKRPPPVFFTPSPCIPATAAPWAPGSATVLIGGVPALDAMSKCMCNWGGVIQFVNPGQQKSILNK